MASLDSILNWAIPTLLILVAFGFVYTKFLSPYLVPHLVKLWAYMNGEGRQVTVDNRRKEIVYE